MFFSFGYIKGFSMFDRWDRGDNKGAGSGFQVPAKLYRIGEIIQHTPYSRQTIHNYTIMGLITEAAWTQGGHRLYDESVFKRLSQISELRKSNTLSQIREMLSEEKN